MKILAILRPPEGSNVRDAVMRHARLELEALWGLYKTGFVREMYSPGGLGAILVLEDRSIEDAQSRLSGLPLLQNHIMQLELIELHPFSAIERLFETANSPTPPGPTTP